MREINSYARENATEEDIENVIKVIEKIIPEYGGADDLTKEAIGRNLKKEICAFLEKYKGMSKEEIRRQRYERFRNF